MIPPQTQSKEESRVLRFGLRTEDIEKITKIFRDFPEVRKAVIYGSRAKGNFRPGSDIDLALFGANLDLRELRKIMDGIEELLLPYTIDLSIYDLLRDDSLREHINRVGQVFYDTQDFL